MSLFYEYFNDALPVPGHEDEGVDGDVGGDVDDVLDGPAPGEAEGPVHEDVVTLRVKKTTNLLILNLFNMSRLVVFFIRGLQ